MRSEGACRQVERDTNLFLHAHARNAASVERALARKRALEAQGLTQ